MDPTDIRYILDDLACNASQEALQELYMLYYKRIPVISDCMSAMTGLLWN